MTATQEEHWTLWHFNLPCFHLLTNSKILENQQCRIHWKGKNGLYPQGICLAISSSCLILLLPQAVIPVGAKSVVNQKIYKNLQNEKSIGGFGKFQCVPGNLEHLVHAQAVHLGRAVGMLKEDLRLGKTRSLTSGEPWGLSNVS